MKFSDISDLSSITKLTLSVNREGSCGAYNLTIYAKQNDKSSRYLEVEVRSDSKIITIPNTAIARIRCTKPDGTSVLNDGCVHNGKIYVELSAQILAAPGVVKADIGIYNGEAVLSTASFDIEVVETPFDEDAVSSADEFSALTEALNTVGNIYAFEAELEDVRTDVNNKNHSSAGEAVRAQINAVNTLIYKGRTEDNTKPTVMLRYSGEMTDLSDMPVDSWVTMNGAEINAMLGESFPWTLGASRTYRVTRSSWTNVSVIVFEIESITGLERYIGYTSSGDISALKWNNVDGDIGDLILLKTADKKSLVDAINEIFSLTSDIYDTGSNKLNPNTVVLGELGISYNGQVVSSETMGTSDFIPTNGKTRMITSWIGGASGNQNLVPPYKLCQYDSDKKFLSGTSTPAAITDLQSDCAFVRITLSPTYYNTRDKYQVEFTDSTQDTYSPFEIFRYIFNGEAKLKNSNDLTYRGNVIELGFTSFAQCKEIGFYNFTTAQLSEITDKGDIEYGGVLEVLYPASANVTFQRVTTTSGDIYFRYSTREFVKIASNETATADNALTWYALGDSITEGYYSEFADGETETHANLTTGWVRDVAAIKNYNVVNYGKGGSGFVKEATYVAGRNEAINARELVNTIDFSECDLVTIGLGVNDWKGNKILGSMADDVATGGTIYSNMRYVIEKIQGDNPFCKIIVLTPYNCSLYGDEATNWGLGHSFSNNGTLEDIFNAEVEVCEYYGIEYIDLTHGSIINRLNINTTLPDKVHPNRGILSKIAREIAEKIKF